MHLEGKKVILAVSGSIAAYKTPHLVRLLVKAGASVRVIMTPSAGNFVSPLSLATVSRNPVYSNVNDGASWNNHVDLGRWADVLLVAPCSANTLSKLANGICDNLLTAVYLSAMCPVVIAPAMDEDMWLHPATHSNLNRIRSYGNIIIPVGHGELASGLVGAGRMAEPEEIIDFLSEFFVARSRRALSGVKAVVTAGPTYERLDPVRFIGNFSTGKMGIALAEALAEQGASVTLVLGPTHLGSYHPNITLKRVENSDEMYREADLAFADAEIGILSAAVADFRPETVAENKIKKGSDTLSLSLIRTKDILAALGAKKKAGQYLAGFALETENELVNARKKLESKNADMIVLNSLNDEGAGFGHDTNKVTLLTASGVSKTLPMLTKKEVAQAIINHILEERYVEKIV